MEHLKLENIEYSFIPHFQNKIKILSGHDDKHANVQEIDAEDKQVKLALKSIKYRKK
jgi:hypothetical protein